MHNACSTGSPQLSTQRMMAVSLYNLLASRVVRLWHRLLLPVSLPLLVVILIPLIA